MIPISHSLVFASILFALGLVGIVLNRRNIILLLICVELMLLAVNTNFIAFSNYYAEITGQVFVFFILTVAAAEAAIGLAIVMLVYRNQGQINIDAIHHLKG